MAGVLLLRRSHATVGAQFDGGGLLGHDEGKFPVILPGGFATDEFAVDVQMQTGIADDGRLDNHFLPCGVFLRQRLQQEGGGMFIRTAQLIAPAAGDGIALCAAAQQAGVNPLRPVVPGDVGLDPFVPQMGAPGRGEGAAGDAPPPDTLFISTRHRPRRPSLT